MGILLRNNVLCHGKENFWGIVCWMWLIQLGVDGKTDDGIAHVMEGGKNTGRICTDALEKEYCSAKFRFYYQTELQKSFAHSNIYRKYLRSNTFLYFSAFDENAFSKLMVIVQGGINNTPRT